MKKTYVYGLDISLNRTGVAVFTNNEKLVECFSIDTTKEKDLRGKLVLIANSYLEIIKKYPPSTVVMEQGFTKYNTSTQMIFRCFGITNYIFAEYEQITIPSSTIKKIITGHGNSKKEAVRDCVSKIYPEIEISNLDESDAIAAGVAYFRKRGD